MSFVPIPIRSFVLAVMAVVLLAPDASAFRIIKVEGAEQGDKPPAVRYIYPTGNYQDTPLEFSAREPVSRPVINNTVNAYVYPRVNVNVTLRRYPWWRYARIRLHRAGTFNGSYIRVHRAGQFRSWYHY